MMRDVSEHLDFVVDYINEIPYNSAIILTGPNGSGKSLVRKQLSFKLKNDNKTGKVQQVSMQLRTGANMFGLGAFVHDSDWDSTSGHTYYLVSSLIESCIKEKSEDYIVIDEPEIGMSKESQLAVAHLIRDNLDNILSNNLGLMVITHSEVIVKELKDVCDFKYLDIDSKDMTADEWINREIKPTDFKELGKWSHELFLEVRKRSKDH